MCYPEYCDVSINDYLIGVISGSSVLANATDGVLSRIAHQVAFNEWLFCRTHMTFLCMDKPTKWVYQRRMVRYFSILVLLQALFILLTRFVSLFLSWVGLRIQAFWFFPCSKMKWFFRTSFMCRLPFLSIR